MHLTNKSAARASALFLLFSGTFAQAAIVYETGVSNPWSSTSNDTAMNSAFGTGKWVKSNGFNLGLFTDATMVYLDGSHLGANAMHSFIEKNQTSLESYVAKGGHLFINAAPNEGGSFSMGFGVTLNYSNTYSSIATITAAGVAAGLSKGGIATTYGGFAFSHATVTGPISNLVQGAKGNIFGAMDYGSGFVAFGGQTLPVFHTPENDSRRLLVNQLIFVNDAEVENLAVIAAVPEPQTYAMLLAGLGGMGFVARRRKPL